MKRLYIDHAAATPVTKEVIEAMLPYFAEHFGNPSTIYDMNIEIKEVIDEQRAKVANLIGARPGEIIVASHVLLTSRLTFIETHFSRPHHPH